MAVTALWLTDFRCFEYVEFRPDPGVSVIRGRNGAGKTSLLEAVGVLATMRSFRGAHREAMVRRGADRAILRGEVDEGGRKVLIEAELPVKRPGRIQANRQVVRRMADLADSLRISVFSPEDLELVQGPPAGRREFLDSCVVSWDPASEPVISEVERTLRQRGALLRQAHGPAGEVQATLDVWDARLAVAGTKLAEARERLLVDLAEPVADAYEYLAGKGSVLTLAYERSWEGELGDALRAGRTEDLRQQTTNRGPHRDELVISLDGMPARTQASQGEQRCAALALRLAFHELATQKRKTPPVLLLDDVFSELDAHRAGLLAERLPTGQVLLASAVDPPGALSGNVVNIEELSA